MSERSMIHGPTSNQNGASRLVEPIRAEKRGFWGKTWLVIKVIQARLRFVAILAAVGAAILYWSSLKALYEKWTRPILGAESVATADTEYWCPMHPTVVRDHPDKCPICGMPLSKRKKSDKAEGEPLPPGVISRVTISPYRVALAGIQTAVVGYQPLTRDITTVGFVEFDERQLRRISWRVSGKGNRIDRQYVNFTDQPVRQGEPLADVYSPDLVVTVTNLLDARRAGNASLERMARGRLGLWGVADDQIQQIEKAGKPITHLTIRSPIGGHVIRKYQREGDYLDEGAPMYEVADLSTVWLEAQVYEDDIAFLKEGMAITATTKSFANREFKGKLAFVHPHLDTSTRTLKVRFDIDNPHHELRPGMYATVSLHVPMTQLGLLPPEAGAEQKQAYEQGLVLAVPERAVIDTGNRKILYREAEPDVYEGVEVQLGPRGGAFYPVIRGVRLGDKVATSGSFLIDAETRLTAGAGSTYFGASGGPHGDSHRAATVRPSMTSDEDAKVNAVLARLGPDDRRLAETQGSCPILPQNRLGSMGKPVKLMVMGQMIFLCCKGCVDEALANEKATLAKAAEQTAKTKAGQAKTAQALDPKVEANLAKLGAEDRRLAKNQKQCPITEKVLGSMGVPVKVTIKGQPVLLCCPGCVEEAEANPEQTLAKVKVLRGK